MFDEKKFTTAHTQTRDISVNVIAPYVVQCTILMEAEL